MSRGLKKRMGHVCVCHLSLVFLSYSSIISPNEGIIRTADLLAETELLFIIHRPRRATSQTN